MGKRNRLNYDAVIHNEVVETFESKKHDLIMEIHSIPDHPLNRVTVRETPFGKSLMFASMTQRQVRYAMSAGNYEPIDIWSDN